MLSQARCLLMCAATLSDGNISVISSLPLSVVIAGPYFDDRLSVFLKPLDYLVV